MSTPEFIVLIAIINFLLGMVISRRNIIHMSIIYTVICYIITNTVQSGMITIFVNISIVILIYTKTKVKLGYCIIATSLSLAIKFAVDFCVVFFMKIIGLNIAILMNNQLSKTIISYIPLIIIIIGIRYLKHNKKSINIENSFSKKQINSSMIIERITLCISIMITIFLAITAIVLYYNKNMYYNIKNLLILGVLLCLVITLVLLVCLILLYNKRKVLCNIEKNLTYKNLKQVEDTVDALRMQRHDYMNHLQVILMQVSNGKTDEAKKYILSISNDENSTSYYYSTGNSYIDAILNTKKRRASRYNIEFTACIDSLVQDIDLSESELSSVLLNIIDNAIDELKKYDRDNKYIHIDIYSDDYVHNISIKNNGSKINDINKIFEMGYSSKGNNRGYGLYSIKIMLESYGSEINVYSDEYETEFEVKIPIIVHSKV